jgi:hypothetical protein
MTRKEGLGQVAPVIEECEAEFARVASELRKITE